MKKFLRATSTVIFCLMFIITSVFVVMKFMGETPTLFGYGLYYILTGSMEPELSPGDIIIAKNVNAAELAVDDVVIYYGETGETKGKIITHKIIDIKEDADGTVFTTKGTANDIADPPVGEDQIIAKMEVKIPLAGKIFSVVNTRWGFFIIIILPLGFLLTGEVVSLVRACKELKEEQSDAEKAEGEDTES